MVLNAAATTANPEELAKFAALADRWWDTEGAFKPLHDLNPTRIAYIRDSAAATFGRDARSIAPFEGLSLVDIGCGGGLIAEPMARLGFGVTGIDGAAKNIAVAGLHAERMGLKIDYRTTLAEDLVATGERFDVVLSLEVVEHVADPALFLQSISALVKPGGLFIGATLNRTAKSFLMAKVGAEYVARWLPRGTHDWRKFVKPSAFAHGLRDGGLEVDDIKGMTWKPLTTGWGLSDDLSVNYLIRARRA